MLGQQWHFCTSSIKHTRLHIYCVAFGILGAIDEIGLTCPSTRFCVTLSMSLCSLLRSKRRAHTQTNVSHRLIRNPLKNVAKLINVSFTVSGGSRICVTKRRAACPSGAATASRPNVVVSLLSRSSLVLTLYSLSVSRRSSPLSFSCDGGGGERCTNTANAHDRQEKRSAFYQSCAMYQ